MPAGTVTLYGGTLGDLAGAFAAAALFRNRRALAPALRTGRRNDEEALLMRDLASTVAGAAALRLGSRLGPRSFAGLAGRMAIDLKLALDAFGRFEKRHRKFDLDVVAARNSTASAAKAGETPAEDVRERREDVLDAAEALEATCDGP